MKMNKFTSALVALGIVSLAGVAHATNPVVYLTGSTAARTIIATALTTSGTVFDGASSIVSPSPNNKSTGSLVVFEGKIGGVTTDISCSWNGSEAGIAAIVGTTAVENPGSPSGTSPLPGSPASFLTSPSWNSTSVLQGNLAMADTSQAVSLTSASLHPCVNYGLVGIVPFTIMKGHMATPSTSWSDLSNVTTVDMNNLASGPIPASFITGNTADTGSIGLCGRNCGSGTRANALLSFQYGVTVGVDQFAYGYYPDGATLTFGFSGATTNTEFTAANYPTIPTGTGPTDVGDDGYDTGGSVALDLQVDRTGANLDGTPGFTIAYIGMSDEKTAAAGTSGPAPCGPAIPLTFNGVYESDTAVINGSYTYWGQEHLYGTPGQSSSSTAGVVAVKIVTGINTVMAAAGGSITTSAAAGACGGTVATGPQSVLIPVTLMQASRGQDGGFPTPGGF